MTKEEKIKEAIKIFNKRIEMEEVNFAKRILEIFCKREEKK